MAPLHKVWETDEPFR